MLGGEGGARRADPRPARGRAAGKLHARPAAAQAVPADQRRQARSRAFSRARRSTRRRCWRSRTRSSRWNGRKSVGGLDGLIARTDANAAALDRIVADARLARPSRRRSGDALEDQRLPDGRRRRRRRHQGASPSCSRRKAPPTTSPAIATPRRACASGAARRSTPPTSRRSGRGSTGPGSNAQ